MDQSRKLHRNQIVASSSLNIIFLLRLTNLNFHTNTAWLRKVARFARGNGNYPNPNLQNH